MFANTLNAGHTRRDLLRTSAFSIAAFRGGLSALAQETSRAPEFDLLLTGARVMDPAKGFDRTAYLAIRAGKISAIAPSIASERAARVIPVRGCLLTPGLVDIHVHGFRGVSHAGVELDTYCIGRGVTTAVDAGTSGADSFAGFRRQVIAPSSTRVLAFLNMSRIGLISPLGELVDRRMIDREAALRACREHADAIVGIKVRCTHFYSGPNDLEAVRTARGG